MEKYIKDENGNWIPNPLSGTGDTGEQPVRGSDLNISSSTNGEEPAKQAELDRINKENKVEIEKISKENSETVTVNKKALDDVLGRLKRLENVADVGRLGRYDEKSKGEIKRIVLLSTWDGKVVTGWKLTKDDVQKVNGIWREFQLIQIKLEDDTTVDLPYLQFSQEVVKVDSEIISRTKENDGHETLKVLRKDNGKEYSIDVTFVN